MKYAVCLGPPGDESASIVRCMLAALTDTPGRGARVFRFQRGAVGLLTRVGRPQELDERTRSDDGRLTLVTGDPVSVRERVSDVLQSAHEAEDGGRVLATLDGAFLALQVDANAGRCTIVTDFLGMAPAFIARRNGAFLLASSASAILADPEVSAEPDAAGWGAMLGFGSLIGNRTKLAAVRRMAPATIMELDGSGDLADERSYWSWPRGGERAPTIAPDEVLSTLEGAVAAYRRELSADTVLLSGGYDSRLIAALLARRGDRPHAVVQRHPDENANADGRFGIAVARRLGFPVEVADVSRDFFSGDDYLAYLRGSDVDVPSLYLFIASTARLTNPARGAVWLDTVLGPLLKRKAPAPTVAEYAARVMGLRSLRDRLGALGVFSPEWRDAMTSGAQVLLGDEIAQYPDDMGGVRELRFRSRTRHRIGAHFYRVHAGQAPIATPGLDRVTWDALLRLRGDRARAQRRLDDLFRAHFTNLTGVPFASGTELSRASLRALPKLSLQRVLAAGQAAARRRPLRQLVHLAGLSPFEWRRSTLLDNLGQRIEASDVALEPRQPLVRTPAEDAALLYWLEHRAIVERARSISPIVVHEVSMDNPRAHSRA